MKKIKKKKIVKEPKRIKKNCKGNRK